MSDHVTVLEGIKHNSRIAAVRIIVRAAPVLAICWVAPVRDGLVATNIDPCAVSHNVPALNPVYRKKRKSRRWKRPYSTEGVRLGVHYPLGVRVQSVFCSMVSGWAGRSGEAAHRMPMLDAHRFSLGCSRLYR